METPTQASRLTLCLVIPVAMLSGFLTSCQPVPRAIIPPPSVIAELNVQPVSDAATKTRDAVRGVAAAGSASREASRKLSDTSVRLRASIDRAEMLSAAKQDLESAFAEIQRFAIELAADVENLRSALSLAEEKEQLAIQTVDALTLEISIIKENSAAQATQIRHAKAAESTLRTQVEALAESADKRVIAEDKLAFWRWKFAPVSIGIIALLIAFIIYRPRIPFL